MFRSVIEHAYRHPPSVEVGGLSSGLGAVERFTPLREWWCFRPKQKLLRRGSIFLFEQGIRLAANIMLPQRLDPVAEE